MSIMELGALAGAVLCAGYLIKYMKNYIAHKKQIEAYERFVAGWSDWGTLTSLRGQK